MRPHRISLSIDRCRRLMSEAAVVHLHPTEVVSKAWLEVGSGGCLKCLPGEAERLMHDAGCVSGSRFGRSRRLGLQRLHSLLCLAISAPTAELGERRSDGEVGTRHAHHLFGYAVRL